MNTIKSKRLGISVYPSHENKKETIEYIELAFNAGFRRIFANLLQVKKDKAGKAILDLYKEIFVPAREMGFEVILDVDNQFYKDWNQNPKDYSFAISLGATGLRFDGGYNGEVEAEIANNNENFKIELNASTEIDTINRTIKYGGDIKNIIACHNFYPMEYTGMSFEKFIERSAIIKSKGINVAAFVGLDKKYKGIGPWEINDGLCTVESQRKLTTIDQFIEMLGIDVIDDICLGEQADLKLAKELFQSINDTFKLYNSFINNKIVELKVIMGTSTNVMDEIIFNPDKPHINRYDMNSYFFRSSWTRITHKEFSIPPLDAGRELEVGDVVVVNNNKGRYKGELHIITKPFLDKDKSKNFVGKILPIDIPKLKWIKDSNKTVILKKKFRLM